MTSKKAISNANQVLVSDVITNWTIQMQISDIQANFDERSNTNSLIQRNAPPVVQYLSSGIYP